MTFKTHFGEAKVSYKEKTQANPIKLSVKASNASAVAGSTCTFCGKNYHVHADCRTRTSEFSNNQNRPYIDSEAHIWLVKAVGGRDWIPNFKELQSLLGKTGQPSGSSPSAVKPIKLSKDWKSKGMYLSTVLPIKLHNANSSNLLPVMLTFTSQEEAKGSTYVDALLDTGCLAGDFIARRIVDKYDIEPVLQSTAKLSVCNGLDNNCYDISKSVIISVHYFNERYNIIYYFNINTFEYFIL